MRRRAALGVVLVVLTIILSGCASTAAKIIVVTATPAPSPSPTVSATPSPTQQAGGIQLTGVQVENGSLARGETVTLDYTIDNETGTAQDVTLAASIYSDGNS